MNECEQLIRQVQGRGVQMQVEQLPISAIVRSPLLAIRWLLPNQKVIEITPEACRANFSYRFAVSSSGSSRAQSLTLRTVNFTNSVFT